MIPSVDPGASTRWSPRLAALLAVPVVALAGCSTGEVDVSEPLEATADAGERAQRTAAALEEAGLGTLASAIREVDLDDVVATSEFTILAPDDAAFQSLTADELADLTSDTERMLSMLRGHVVEGAVSADELRETEELTTVAGTTLEVRVEDGAVRIGDGEVLETMRLEDGVVVHVTDALLARE